MSDFKILPDSDPDLTLARQYGKVLTDETEVQEIRDPVFNLLVQARRVANQSETDIPLADAERTWSRIQSDLQESEAGTGSTILPLPFSSVSTKWYWATAAVILIAVTSMFLLRPFTDPVPKLLAESGASISVVELANGSRATLRPHSRLYELSSTDRLQSYSLNGEALFEVESQSERIFSVEAGPGRVVVTGTRFTLTDRDELSTVHLLDGSVIFETADRANSVTLSAGEAAVINRESVLGEPFAVDAEEITGWTQNRLTFRDRPMADILSELEFHYNITIQVPDKIEQITLGGSVALDSPEQSLEDLGTVLGGEFIQTDHRSYQFRPLP